MSQKIRLEDIAKECGVTKGLVSRALAGKYNVGDEMRSLIMQKAVEMGYDFDKLRSKTKKKQSVLLVISSRILLKEDFWQPIIKNIYAALNRVSIKLEYFVFEEDNLDVDAVRALKNNPAKAIVVIHSNPDDLYKELSQLGKLIVEVDPKNMHSEGVTQIKLSNYNSMYEATQKLIDKGHKHICFFGSDMHAMSFRERHEGFLACIDRNSSKGVRGTSVIFDNTNLQYSDNEMLEAAINKEDFTAIICANDICAHNAYKVIKRMGKSIPWDYSIIGFDNIKDDITANPSLSTFNVPREQLGTEIGHYLVGLFEADSLQYSELVIRCEYIERESVRKIN
ncbi:MAG: LacI family DNA-binding transcriptional regulator [Bacilli bacterium]|nr:LacI family DNA-binding transcriptional regulator [Bacilli bacterium]